MLKLFRVTRISVVIRNMNSKSDSKAFFKVLWLVFSLFLVVHILGCLWFYVVKVDEEWVVNREFVFPANVDYLYEVFETYTARRYLISFYTGFYLITSNEMCP